jgi:ribonuclease PH
MKKPDIKKDLEVLMKSVKDDDWVLVITPNGDLKTVLMPRDNSRVNHTIKQVLAMAESGMEEAISQEFEEDFPHLANRFGKRTLN